jgi:hypothetical protein
MNFLLSALFIVSCCLVAADAGFLSEVKCRGCKKLGPLAGTSICRSQCNRLDIFPGTCAKLCTWMITKHPETACKLAKMCPSRFHFDSSFEPSDDNYDMYDEETQYEDDDNYDMYDEETQYRDTPDLYGDEFEENADMLDLFDNFKWYGNWCGPGWTGGKYISARKYVSEGHNWFYPCIDEVDCACREHDFACGSSDQSCCRLDDERLAFVAKKYGKTWKARRVATAMNIAKHHRKC